MSTRKASPSRCKRVVAPSFTKRASSKSPTTVEARPPAPFGIAAIPLFYESARAELVARVIVTACQDDTQRARLVARGLSEPAAEQRIAAQLPTREKVGRADYTIWTDLTDAETDRQVDEIYARLSADTPSDRQQQAAGRRPEAGD